jgi:hypothetical protein
MKPNTKKEIHTWTAVAGYYRKHISRFAQKAKPLYDAINGKSKIPKTGLTEKMKQAIATIKNSLTTEPVLAHPRFDNQFTIATDASISGLGAAPNSTYRRRQRGSNSIYFQSTPKT